MGEINSNGSKQVIQMIFLYSILNWYAHYTSMYDFISLEVIFCNDLKGGEQDEFQIYLTVC